MFKTMHKWLLLGWLILAWLLTDFEQFKKIISHFADSKQVKKVSSYFADFEQVKKVVVILLTLNKSVIKKNFWSKKNFLSYGRPYKQNKFPRQEKFQG